MNPTFQLRPEMALAYAAAVLFDVAYPLVLAFIARRRLSVGWRYFLYGALIFFLFQLITRVPAVQIIQGLIAPQLQASRVLLFVWIGVLALTAGLFEEVGRYVGYRWLMGREDKTWRKAVMYGLGHGGLESIVLVGGLVLLTLINLIALSNMDLNLLPPAQRTLVQQQLAALSQQPAWLPLVGAYERLWTVPIQVALSVTVLQVFRRGSLVWLWLAIFAHALVDFVTVTIVQFPGLQGMMRIWVPEAIVTLAGLIAVWIIFALREPTSPRVQAVPPNPANGGQ
jgi:uncharacterized membrane protein YhfC